MAALALADAAFFESKIMADDYFTDGASEIEEGSTTAPEESDQDSEENIAILPVGFFRGKDLEVGKTCTIRVENIGDDQVQVSYVSTDQTEEYDQAEDAGGELEAEMPMSAMME